MTVSSTQVRVAYVGDGSSVNFTVPWLFYANTDLLVMLGYTPQSSGYTVSGAGTGSGIVTFSTPPASGVNVQVILNVPLTQQVNLVDGTAFPSATINQENDRSIQASLRLSDIIGRTIRAPDGDLNAWQPLPPAAARANLGLVFDASGNPTVGNLSSAAFNASQSFTATQGQTVFNLAVVTNVGNIIVVTLNGIVLVPVVDYTASGFTVTLTNGANAGDTLYVIATVAISNVNNQIFNGGASDVENVHIVRNANYSGGTPGFVNSAVRVETNVSGAGAAAFEWSFLSVMNNSATGGENVGGYFQGNKVTSGAGPTWGGTIELRELVPINDPNVGTVGLEVDHRSNGTDAHFSRVGLDLVCTRYNNSGAATTVGFGFRLQNNNDTSGSNCTISNAFSVWQAKCQVAFDCATSTVTSGSLRMADGVPILFDISGGGGGTVNKLVGTAASGLDHQFNGVLKNRLLGTGGLQVGSNQVVGPRITGYGTPTNAANQGSFDATAITLVSLAKSVAQLILDLKTHGLLGT